MTPAERLRSAADKVGVQLEISDSERLHTWLAALALLAEATADRIEQLERQVNQPAAAPARKRASRQRSPLG